MRRAGHPGGGAKLATLPRCPARALWMEQSPGAHCCSWSFPTGGRSTASPPGKAFLVQSGAIRVPLGQQHKEEAGEEGPC